MLENYDQKLDQLGSFQHRPALCPGFECFFFKSGLWRQHAKFYFKALRADVNRANAEGVGSAATYPFGRGGSEGL